MKIKTITCHNVYNHGATLQAYALMAYLKNKGHDVVIINYLPAYLRIRTHLLSVSSNWIDKPRFLQTAYLAGKLPVRLLWPFISCKKAFDAFNRKYLKITKRKYRTYKQLCQRPPEADLYLAGSDQIWNTSYNNGRDPAFFLGFGSENILRASFAASFGLDEIVERFIPFVKEQLYKLDKISVRETIGVEIVESFGLEAVHVCDPVFLLDPEDWKHIYSNGVMPEKPYMLIYDFDGSAEFKTLALGLSKKNNFHLYSINNYRRCEYADRDFYKSGPEDFLSLIKNADLVVSNSFHATAFALIFETPFYTLPRLKDKVNSRMQSLLSTCGMENRFVHDYWNKDPDDFEASSPCHCSDELDHLILRSKTFLAGITQQ